MENLKVIDFNQNSFEADGETFYIDKTLSLRRFEEFEVLIPQLTHGTTFLRILQEDRQIWDLLNQNKLADAAIIIHNRMTSIKGNIEKRLNPVLLLCALFLNTKDENRAEYNEALMNEKIQKWYKEGIEVNSFFQLAFNLVNTFVPILDETSQDISKQEQE